MLEVSTAIGYPFVLCGKAYECFAAVCTSLLLAG